ncbi:MAG: single-stranded DNA-binding protein [Bacteroidales bacterium]|nr:single-stranded DNA-binding protein [Bacteroidales bacterium]MBQ9312925.1 single-stranded DNA-binding protein [Bacteroidales bacterium]
MIGVNKVILIGNLGKDPEIVMFDNVKKASFPLATTEQYKNHDGIKVDETEWHNIVCWRGLADVADKFLRKSMQVYIEGKLKSRQWEDKDGNKRRTVEVVAENFKILTRNYTSQNTTTNSFHSPSSTSVLDEFSTDEFSIDTDSNLADIASDDLKFRTNKDLPF